MAEETISQHALSRTLQAEEQFIAQYKEMNSELYNYGQKAQFYSSLTNPSTRLINAISYILCGFLASYLALKGELSSRRFGRAVRLEVTENCPQHIYEYLLEEFHDYFQVD